ncbi:hypothetical protein BCR12_04125 [Limnothrix sp. P13C2]|nr:hypothetical protein BCR12_04125 [Limnothrix sp. P13C2]
MRDRPARLPKISQLSPQNCALQFSPKCPQTPPSAPTFFSKFPQTAVKQSPRNSYATIGEIHLQNPFAACVAVLFFQCR